MRPCHCRPPKKFLSTPSARRATLDVQNAKRRRHISIHALREEGDRLPHRPLPPIKTFLSTPSARRATSQIWPLLSQSCISIHALREEGDFLSVSYDITIMYFYPRPPRGGRPKHPEEVSKIVNISIHALREEGDFVQVDAGRAVVGISIHALREEGDLQQRLVRSGILREFLSTPSARRATAKTWICMCKEGISIHALREEGDSAACRQTTMSIISIHALREEGDRFWIFQLFDSTLFLSTPSARRATLRGKGMALTRCDFYPRPPRGGRP